MDRSEGSSPGWPAPEGDRAGRKLVLFIEDNETDRHLYGSLLWYNGYDLQHAPDGESGIAKALSERPDLILLDLQLEGDVDGLEVLRRIREAGLDVPVVALTGTPREKLGEATAGFVGYLQKPVAPVDVVREVRRHIGDQD